MILLIYLVGSFFGWWGFSWIWFIVILLLEGGSRVNND